MVVTPPCSPLSLWLARTRQVQVRYLQVVNLEAGTSRRELIRNLT